MSYGNDYRRLLLAELEALVSSLFPDEPDLAPSTPYGDDKSDILLNDTGLGQDTQHKRKERKGKVR